MFSFVVWLSEMAVGWYGIQNQLGVEHEHQSRRKFVFNFEATAGSRSRGYIITHHFPFKLFLLQYSANSICMISHEIHKYSLVLIMNVEIVVLEKVEFWWYGWPS